jgi:carbonic anhydrase
MNILSRRNIIRLSAGAAGAGLIGACAPKNAGNADVTTSTPTTGQAATDQSATPVVNPADAKTPDEALKHLVDGNQRFVDNKPLNPDQTLARVREVAETQKPFAAILGCADSRVPVEILFDQGFGNLFVCRVAGNIATPEEIGSLEFGSAVLGAKAILVLGHERCGAVDATIKGAAVPGQISSLLDAIKPAVESSKGKAGDPLENACKANVAKQVENLMASPVLSQLVKEGKLKIAGGYYDLDTGKVTMI